MKRYTDQFETVLPTEELQRVVAPGLFLCPTVTRETLNEVRQRQEEFRKVCEPPPQKPIVAVNRFPRWPLGVIMTSIVVILLALALSSRKDPSPPAPEPQWTRIPRVWKDESRERPALIMQRPDEIVSAPPVPTPAPTPEPAFKETGFTSPSWIDPWKHWKPVPRAQPVETRPDTIAHMPDGSTQAVTVVGAVNRQEELPLNGNSIGDTYYVAGIPFVWTQLENGTGAWIDPIIK